MNDREALLQQLANQERKRTNWLKTKIRKFAIWLNSVTDPFDGHPIYQEMDKLDTLVDTDLEAAKTLYKSIQDRLDAWHYVYHGHEPSYSCLTGTWAYIGGCVREIVGDVQKDE